ncbi:type II toxin-antitoxin system ParD family antitoxin [Jiella marina]|uniref:type II toxin-antitoxin system ParD family antitoxin n=1 Tax=Jiella sp. LLJ827 TaxID=2917712 RepID=UPI0021008028|nr:type II toxin-antitoxin system ParD family antitoxin [Jiella sp. LLJ827]MCQ0987109.1 type II toxin-antitoxin system ParD family antitoxin [Jiella sp. LLJ827]
MSSVKTFQLGQHFETFVEAQVEEGRFASADEVVRAGLSLLERESAEEEARIRAAIEEGFASGEPTSFDFEAFRGRMHERLGIKE